MCLVNIAKSIVTLATHSGIIQVPPGNCKTNKEIEQEGVERKIITKESLRRGGEAEK